VDCFLSGEVPEAIDRDVDVDRVKFHRVGTPARFFGRNQCSSAAGKAIEHDSAALRAVEYRVGNQLCWLDCWMSSKFVEAAGVPQGSFTNHFASKEAFCLEVLDRYFDDTRALISRTLRNDSLPPLQRLRAFLDATAKFLDRKGLENGCLIGNFSVEASDHSEIILTAI